MIRIMDKKTPYAEALLANGSYQLDPICISAEVTEDIYGNFDLNMELELAGNVPPDLYEFVNVDNIVVVDDEQRYQQSKWVEIFRIAQVEKTLDTITVYARHITIADSLNIWLNDVRPTDKNGADALKWMCDKATNKCDIRFTSDIKEQHSANYIRKSLYDAIAKGDNCFLNVWGGEIKRYHNVVSINKKIGKDKTESVIIKEGLNLTEFDGKANIDDVITVIYPLGFDGLQGERVESKYLKDYSMEFPRMIKYEDVKVRKQNDDGTFTEGFATEEEAKAELKKRAEAEFTINKVDKINFEIDVDYLDLERFEEYKDLTQLERAYLGDYITCRVDTFGFDLKVRVVKRVYDVLRGRRISNTISTTEELKKPNTVKEIVKQEIQGVENGLSNLEATVCNLHIGGYNYVVNSDKKLQSVTNDEQKQEYQFIDKAETMKYLQGQDITISCEVDGDVELESGGVLFQYQLEGQDTYTDVKAEVTTSSTGKKRIWVRVKLP